jgi:hypothetical protein
MYSSIINDNRYPYLYDIPKNTYHQYCKNVYSQNGEDGILEQLFKEMKIEKGKFCEFGASDGISSSNSLNLIKKGWTGILIEGNPYVYKTLIFNMKNYENQVVLIQDLIENESNREHSLNTHLKNNKYPKDFDLLSIDIDMNDYYVWKNLIDFEPKIVIIETNSYRDPLTEEIPSSNKFSNDLLSTWYPDRVRNGSSFMSVLKLGLNKGYIPIAYTGNIIFIHNKYISFLKEFPYRISSQAEDYLDLYTNLVLWDNKWYTNSGLIINVIKRNYSDLTNEQIIEKFKKLNQRERDMIFIKDKESKKTLALCCSGQIRNGRFTMNNHKIYLIDYFKSLGYEIDFFIYTDKYNTYRKGITNGKISYDIELSKKNRIYEYFYTLTSDSCVGKKELFIDETQKLDDMDNNYFIEQFRKYYKILKTVNNTGKIYDIVIRYRFDTIFYNYPIIPKDNQYIQGHLPKFNYTSDMVQIFGGQYLNSLVNNFEQLDFNKTSNILNNLRTNSESIFNFIYQQSGLVEFKQNDLIYGFVENTSYYFRGINWKYYNDHINRESPPHNHKNIINCLNIRNMSSPSKNLISFDKNNEDIYFYDYCSKNESIPHKLLILSAFGGGNLKINIPVDNELYKHIDNDFMKDFNKKHIAGIIPLGGTASRVNNLPKFLFPCSGDTSLLGRLLNIYHKNNIFDIVAGVSETNSSLLTNYDNIDKKIVNTKTMSETIYSILEMNSDINIMFMPDTYFTINDEIQRCIELLQTYKIVVFIWEIKKFQIGKVGQCNIDIKNGQVIDIIDKDKNCNYDYMWGGISWTREMNQYINPSWNTIGNLIKKSIELNIKVGYVKVPNDYYDCGTYDEYFQMIKNTT